MKRKAPTMVQLQQLALDAYADTPEPFGVQATVRDGKASVLLVGSNGAERGEFAMVRANTDDIAKRALAAALRELRAGAGGRDGR